MPGAAVPFGGRLRCPAPFLARLQEACGSANGRPCLALLASSRPEWRRGCSALATLRIAHGSGALLPARAGQLALRPVRTDHDRQAASSVATAAQRRDAAQPGAQAQPSGQAQPKHGGRQRRRRRVATRGAPAAVEAGPAAPTAATKQGSSRRRSGSNSSRSSSSSSSDSPSSGAAASSSKAGAAEAGKRKPRRQAQPRSRLQPRSKAPKGARSAKAQPQSSQQQQPQGGALRFPRGRLSNHLQQLAQSALVQLAPELPGEGPDGGIDMREAQRRVGHTFRRPGLLRVALLHGSRSPSLGENVLAWLGDALLYFFVTEQLAATYTGASLRSLHDARERLVSRQSCALRARRLGLDGLMVMGHCVTRHPRRQLDSRGLPVPTVNMAGELYEAILGAVFIDGGATAAARFFAKDFHLPRTLAEIPEPGCELRQRQAADAALQ